MFSLRSNAKFIALATAFIFMCTLFVPVAMMQSADASSKNIMSRVVTVTKDENVGGLISVPELYLDNDQTTWSTDETFRLTLPGVAEWNAGIVPTVSDLNVDNTGVTATKITDQILEINVTYATNPAKDERITIPMDVTLDGASGEIKVTVDPRDSSLSAGTYTFAVAEAGATVATVASKEKITRGTAEVGANIILDETVIGSLSAGDQRFRVRLPNNFEWAAGTVIKTNNLNVTAASLEIDGNPIAGVPGVGADINYAVVAADLNGSRDLIVEFNIAAGSTIRGSIIIEPVIKVNKDASMGDVAVSISKQSGDVSNVSGLIIAEYLDYGFKVEIDEVKEFYAGRDDADYITDEITIKENIANSFFAGRTIDFQLPKGIMIRDDFNVNLDTSGAQLIDSKTGVGQARNVNSFEVDVAAGDTEITMEIPLTIEGIFVTSGTQDIVLTMSGAGLEETELVIATAVAPVTVEVGAQEQLFDVGVQKQAAPEITIKEAYAGAIRDANANNQVDIFVRDAFANSMRFDDFEWEVIEGDIEIDSVDKATTTSTNDTIRITVDAQSDVASTIRLYDIEMTLDRTVPKGPFRLDIGGNALVDNGNFNDGDFVNRVARFDYVEVGTPTAGATTPTVVFTIGDTSYTVGSQEKTMDVAPYIKDDRTFLPVRFVAESLGVSESNIIWNDETKNVTILKGDRIVSMQIGSNVLTVNGTPIHMNTAPEISSDRTMLPVFFIGQALGASLEWDGENRTVTID